MSLVWHRRERTSQPQSVVAVNAKYADALTVFNAATPAINLATRRPIIKVGAPTIGVSQNGIEVHSDTFSSGNLFEVRTGINPSIENWPGVTIICDLVLTPYTLYPSVSYLAPSGEYYGGWNLTTEGTRSIMFYAGDSAAAINISYTGVYENLPATIIAVFDKANGTRSLHLKTSSGHLFASGAHAVGWRNSASIENLCGYFRGGYRTAPHKLSMQCALPRAIGASELTSLLDNPWQIFQPEEIPIWVPDATGGITEAGASAAGTSTVTGVSGATAGGVASTAGAAAATGAASAGVSSTASAAGESAAAANTAALFAGVGASSGTSASAADALSITAGVAASVGGSAASADASAMVGGIGAAVGASTASADAEAVGAGAVGESSGTSTASAAASAITGSVAAATGVATASADAENAGTGSTIIESTASASGTATASAVTSAPTGSVGASAGVATASAGTSAITGSVGASVGQAAAAGGTAHVLGGVGTSAGAGAAGASAAAFFVAYASSDGYASAESLSGATAGCVAYAAGMSTCLGVSGVSGLVELAIQSSVFTSPNTDRVIIIASTDTVVSTYIAPAVITTHT